MSSLGLYRPGRSILHAAPAWAKLLGLVTAGCASVLVHRPWQAATLLGVALAGHLVARVPAGVLLRQLRPLVWVLLLVGAFHLLVDGWERAVTVTGVLLSLFLLAGLVTLTTLTTELVDILVGLLAPLRRFGFDAERAGLLLTLAIRSVFVVAEIAEEIRDAQRARGLTSSPRAFAVPFIIRSLRHADQLGEALAARGVDD
jgi:biotin transport system permease protein